MKQKNQEDSLHHVIAFFEIAGEKTLQFFYFLTIWMEPNAV